MNAGDSPRIILAHMPLQAGSTLGAYKILNPLGAGGMGEVYRARDTTLNRDVAIKVLPATIANQPDRVGRFTREAQLLAALNHPNIAAIYGVEHAGASLALVLEYVDGDTLADRINRGPMPLADVLDVALQICRAIEAAHEKGVIHRDLKPANVKLTTTGSVKVLDFGLAKALEQDATQTQNLSQSPTLSIAATSAGVLLGTVGYMAPEQARGTAVDRRADVWAFGVVLFEMLSGRPVFEGQTVADTIANLLQREPDWNQLPPAAPAALRKLVKRCLTKNPRDRLQAIGDARLALEEIIADPSAQQADEPGSSPRWKKVLPWAVLAGSAPLFVLAGYLVRPSATLPEASVSQFEVTLPSQVLAHNFRHGVSLSPDGRRMAWIGRPDEGQGPRRIYVRSLDSWDIVALSGTDGAQNLAFSPDGQWIAFQQRQQLKKVAVGGGNPVVLVERLDNQGADWGPPGITWGSNDTIVFPQQLGAGLSAVRANGGEPTVFTTLDTKANESSHRLPHFLPDGSAVLFTVLRYTNITPDWKRAEVWVQPVGGERTRLLEEAMDAQYAGNNVLVFARHDKLFAVRFDPAALTVSGKPVQVVDGVARALYGNAAVQWSGAAQFSVAADGTLLYAPGSIEPPQLSTYMWMDRKSRATTLIEGMRPMMRFAPRVLPDGHRVAFSELHVNKDIWIYDTVRGTEDRATYEGQNSFPIWSPDGSRMAFRSDRAGPLGIYVAPASNPRQVTPVTPGPLDIPSSWTPDGKTLAFTRGLSATGGNTDIYVVSVDQPGDARPLIATMASEAFPEFSPNGKWIAYVSNESGRAELYVQPYPGSGNRVTVSSGGGVSEPAWSRNSNELFYRVGPAIMSVRYGAGDEFVPERPEKLFDQPPLLGGTSVRVSYDVAPDGRFLFGVAVPDGADERIRRIFPRTLRVAVNWTTAANRLLAGQ